jgi:hypothetical protein
VSDDFSVEFIGAINPIEIRKGEFGIIFDLSVIPSL